MAIMRCLIPFTSCWMIILTTSLLLVGASAAFAESEQATKAREREAKKACLSAVQYERGIDILAELYVDTNNATYIYNQGRCYQQNGKYDKALNRFQEYRRKSPKLSASDVADIENRIHECEERVAQAAPPTVQAAPSTGKDQSTTGPGSLPDVLVGDPPPPEVEHEQDGRGLRIAGGILSGVGLIAIGAGVTMNYLYSEKAKTPDKGTYAAEISDKTDAYRVGAWVGYGVGAAALVTGVTLYLLGSRSASGKSPEKESIAWIPTYNGETASLLLKGAF